MQNVAALTPLCPSLATHRLGSSRKQRSETLKDSFALPCRGLYLSGTCDTGLAFLSQVLLNPFDLHSCDLLSQQHISWLRPAASLCCGTCNRLAAQRLCPPLLSHATIPLQEEGVWGGSPAEPGLLNALHSTRRKKTHL